MKRLSQDFKEAAKKILPKKWNIHDCGICGYNCGYVFSNDYELVGYDSGCNCTYSKNINSSSWEDIANHYNMQTCQNYIKKMDKFWGFQNEN